jgi:thioredoxin reductase
MYDVVVIGAGAAGLNAALVLTRARRRVAVVDGGEPRNAPAAHMHGFLSRDGLPPGELLAIGRKEVEGYGGELIDDKVTAIDNGFQVHLASGRQLQTRRVLVATGLRDELPGIPGIHERFGKDVLLCPYCHGYEVRDQPIGVLDSADHALMLRQWSADVIFFPNGNDYDPARLAARGIRVEEGPVKELVVAEDRLRGVELEGGRIVPRSAVFLRSRMVPHDSLLTELGCEVNDQGLVMVDPHGRTSVHGLWAAGNVVHPHAQVIMAAGAGSAAALAINGDLVKSDLERAVFSPEMERIVMESVVGDRRHGLLGGV